MHVQIQHNAVMQYLNIRFFTAKLLIKTNTSCCMNTIKLVQRQLFV